MNVDSLYYEYWKRYNSGIALEWGMSSFENEEVERPEFTGEVIKSPINGASIRYFNPKARFRRIMGSLVRLCYPEESMLPVSDVALALCSSSS
jgi:hypothetical protein